MKKTKKILSIVLAFSMLFSITSCKNNNKDNAKPTNVSSDNSLPESFNEYLDNVFLEEAQSDTLSLHYMIAHPENYNIKLNETTLGEYYFGTKPEDYDDIKSYLEELKNYDYDKLSSMEKTNYDLFKSYLEKQLELLDYSQLTEVLGPTTGIQAQLPILLAEYTFYDKDDVNDYIGILKDTQNYFSQIAQAEKDKSAAGYFMSDATADQIIDQCKKFIETPESNLLIECFNDKISKVPDITTDEITLFIEQNRDAVLNNVIPAYNTLIETLTSLKGTGKNEAGLSNFENGAKYYELTSQFQTGSSMSMRDMRSTLENTLRNALIDMSTIQMTDPTIFQKYTEISFPSSDPVEIIEILKTAISEDFPLLEEVNYDINYVHKSLQEYLSPAMYLIPPIDEVNLHNNIYINADEGEELPDIFPTIAHEGYPGHLYQTVYYNKTNPSMIRRMLEPNGYVEGWATYVEYYSYDMAGLDKNLAQFMKDNMLATHCLYSLSDIGINYYGWSLSDTADFLSDYGFDEDVAQVIFDTMVSEPGAYLPYGIGCIEFMKLRDMAEDALNDNFNAKAFHEVILKAGPMPFDSLEVFVNEYIKENAAAAPAA